MNGGNDGLLQRIQLAVYPDEPRNWQLVDTPPDIQARDNVYSILENLAETDFTTWGATQGEFDRFPFMHFDAEGQAIFNEWLTELQTVKIPGEDNPLIAEHLGKFRSLMPSLALILHLVECVDGTPCVQVSGQAALQAAAWCDYLESHTRRIYGMAAGDGMAAAIALAGKIQAGKVPDVFKPTDIYRNHWHGLDRDETTRAIEVLQDYDWLLVNRIETGGRPSLMCQINPKVRTHELA